MFGRRECRSDGRGAVEVASRMKLTTKFGVLLWLIMVSFSSFAADTQKDVERDLRQAYVGHILSLKSPSNSDRLRFGPDGLVIGKSNPAPWTTFGLFRVMQLFVKKERVELDGERVIIAWQAEKIPGLTPVEIGRTVRITLESASAIFSPDQVNEMIGRFFDKGSIDKRIADYWKPSPDAIAAMGKPASGIVVLGTLEGNRSVYRSGKGTDIVPPPLCMTRIPHIRPPRRKMESTAPPPADS